MTKKMLINATHREDNRVAIVEDGILSELDIEIVGQEQTRGNIYKGVVSRVEAGLQAAFIDFGSDRSGFLQLGEIHPTLYPPKSNESNGRPRINDILRRGQEILVQVVKEERGTKGAALTTYLSLPGRYMVLMPQSDTKGISRKITEQAERKKLKSAMAELELPDEMGYIIRTAGIGKEASELKRDLNYLLRLYDNIKSLSDHSKAPMPVYRESNLVIRSIRDYFTPEIDEVLIDDPEVYKETKDFFKQLMPEYAHLVKLHQERRPIYSRYQIEEQIESITQNKVNLPSGGSIVIDPTEALVAIDVNSGKMASEKGVEATAYKTNLESVEEVARQLRLRDLGGLIVIDLIDMRDRKHIRDVERALKTALKDDKARVSVGRISQFGLLEMSRQRIKSVLGDAAYLNCPHCNGSGRLLTSEARAVGFMRQIHASVAKGQIGKAIGRVPADVATYLLNNKRKELHELENKQNLSIVIEGHSEYLANQMELELIRRKEMDTEVAKQDQPATAEAARLAEGDTDEKTEQASSSLKADTSEEGKEAADVSNTEGTGNSGRRRRRRRPRRSNRNRTSENAAENGQGEQASTVSEDETASPPNKDQQSASHEAQTEEKPKRPGRPRKKVEQTTETAGNDAAAEAKAEQKPKRPGRPRKKVEQTNETAGNDAAAEAKAEQKPKRPGRPRKKVEQTTETAGNDAAAEAKAEQKPKRPGRPRKKVEQTNETAGNDAAAEAKAEQKPKRPGRPRKKVEQTNETAGNDAAAEAKAKQKPKRPGRPRKKTEETNDTN